MKPVKREAYSSYVVGNDNDVTIKKGVAYVNGKKVSEGDKLPKGVTIDYRNKVG